MKREDISKAVSEINARYLVEADRYEPTGKERKIPAMKAAAAALFFLCLLGIGASLCIPSGHMGVAAYAYGSEEKLTDSGVILSTGSIRDTGEMRGDPLMFYLSGKRIESVRFSCKHEFLCFRDWTEEREEYGNAQNFTVFYGEDEDVYYYLTVEWVPKQLELALSKEHSIAALPAALREDMIVMEIRFFGGKTATKAIWISLLDDGRFEAHFDDYVIGEEDDFVRREDGEILPATVFEQLYALDYQPYTCDGIPEYRLWAEDGTVFDLNFTDRWVWKNRTEQAELTDALIARLYAKQAELGMKAILLLPTTDIGDDLQAAEDAARAYYEGTVFTVVSMEVRSHSAEQTVFSVCVSKGDVIQEPERTITLVCADGAWRVVNEGY